MNSAKDVYHGAIGHREIEPGYWEVEGKYSRRKRFFDRAAINALFSTQ